jgi:NADH:ubiquinone oxidoreductase subunit 5 (subunit L)/multisubunit Na+/H+ antiporter MnhA subunit
MAKWDFNDEDSSNTDMYKSVFDDDKRAKTNEDLNRTPKDALRKEEEQVNDYVKEANNNKTLRKHDIGFYSNRDYDEKMANLNFYRKLSIILVCLIIVFGVVYFTFVNKGSYKATYTDNSTQNINVDTPDVPINQTYNNKFYENNTYVFQFNLSEELGKELSNQVINAFIKKFNLNISNYTNSS